MSILQQKFRQIRDAVKNTPPNDRIVLLLILAAHLSVYLLGAMILFLPLYAFLSHQKELLLPKKTSDYFLIAFALVALLSTLLFSKNSRVLESDFIFRGWHLKLIAVGVLVLVFDIFFFSRILHRKIFLLAMRFSLALSILDFLVGFVQWIFDLSASEKRPGRYASLFSNENYYGTALEFFVLIALYLYFASRSKKEKGFCLAALFCAIAGLFLCECRTAFVVVAFLILLMLLFNGKKKWVFLAGGVGVLLFGITLFYFPDFFPRIGKNMIADNLEYRLGIWKTAWAGIKDNFLIGRGYYAYSALWQNVAPYCHMEGVKGALHAHNLYIEMLLNFGILGTGSLLCFLVARIRQAALFCKNRKNDAALLVGAICAVLLHGILDTTVFWPQTGIFAVILLVCPQIYEEKGE